MSPLDEGFRKRIDKLYDTRRKSFAAPLAGGIKTGKVRKDISPRNVAALVVAAQTGIWGWLREYLDNDEHTGNNSGCRVLPGRAFPAAMTGQCHLPLCQTFYVSYV